MINDILKDTNLYKNIDQNHKTEQKEKQKIRERNKYLKEYKKIDKLAEEGKSQKIQRWHIKNNIDNSIRELSKKHKNKQVSEEYINNLSGAGLIRKDFKNRKEIAQRLINEKLFNDAHRFVRCGAKIMIFKNSKTGEKIRKSFYCDLRICPTCQKIRGAKQRKTYFKVFEYLHKAKKLKYGFRYRFITLTYKKYNDFDFMNKISKSQKDIKNLIKRLKRIYGNGIGAFFHLEISKNGLLHYHGVVYMGYIKQKTLSEIWHNITGDSFIVDIKLIKNLKTDLKEILKYSTKISKYTDWNLLAKIQKALKGKRTLLVYGIFYAKIKYIKDKIMDIVKKILFGSLVFIGFDFELTGAGIFWLE